MQDLYHQPYLGLQASDCSVSIAEWSGAFTSPNPDENIQCWLATALKQASLKALNIGRGHWGIWVVCEIRVSIRVRFIRVPYYILGT